MNLLERVIATRNQVEKLEHDYFLGLIPIGDIKLQMKFIMMKMVGESNVARAMDRKKGRSLPIKLTGDMNPENTMFECPDQDGKFITRQMCLDYSGNEKNHETCQSCKNFSITRRLLAPPKQ